MTEQTPGCGSNSEARKRAAPVLDGCGYPPGVLHAHVEQCHRAERATVLRELEFLTTPEPTAPAADADRYVVTGPGGFTESFTAHQVEVLVRLGLVCHDYDDYVLQDGSGAGVGALHHFYKEASRG